MAKKASRELYKTARTMNDLETLASGDPKKILRRGEQVNRPLAGEAEDLAMSLQS
jgi:hypothetical protein